MRMKNNISIQSKLVSPKTKFLVIVLVLVAGVSFAFNKIYLPQRNKLAKLKSKLVSLDNEIIEMEAQLPNLEGQVLQLEAKKSEIERLNDRLSKKENQLPSKANIPELLSVYLRQSSEDIIDFSLLKPVDEHKKNIYDQLNIEIQFNAGFNGLVNYLNRLEKNFQYIQTKGIVISNEDNLGTGLLTTKIVLSTYLSDQKIKEGSLLTAKMTDDVSSVSTKRDPFYSPGQVVTQDEELEFFNLSGIIGFGLNPTAIIDDEVYKVGDTIGNSKIQEITYNEVILENQGQIRVLTIDSESE